ncbi:CHAT domain-containing protein [Cylindrospermopsis raciborskii]|uniref:Heterocyst differentiation protein n=2 Tax=Cylindrospermopsis raciborskii TaxID=77022 RepID=A0A853M7D7_9CYAN|nr:CHAT domain-containing protein [Cylindrospermopsis raciborskii]EFA69782.1 hetF, heterocyst differentiation protein [Cylindrospermopsis raciborskii CS-505]OBU75310.1 heterocyst differentiation protein [Cylindrospermopsis raciborskii CS-505]PNJ91407.1 heterocyst differentiation protein [Cylindrospermopsis raciborskii C07]PNJ91678.1 heterocyst differentiation protein [Cylindrospermopsis raciborskii C03]PNJ95772.1 heterocyst differentiation protein [Cylindrospermopsis raciborskii C04]
MTQEFHISVTPVGQSDYLVRTEQVALGVPLAEELVTWPVAEWLAAAGHLMNDPLKSVLQGEGLTQSAGGTPRNPVNLVALGQKLYNALFQGTLRDSWITAQGVAQNQHQLLRLRLGIKDDKLARLPWEVMYAGDRPVATGPYIAFSRYQNGVLSVSSPIRLPPRQEENLIKVLMVISCPVDQARLELLKQEALHLKSELDRNNWVREETSRDLPEIELTVLEQPGREELTRSLEQGRYHVLHYSGHSNVGSRGGEIYLVSRRTGLTESLTGDDLAGLLVNNNIQMAVFNSCLGAYRAKSNSEGDTGEYNLTESLVKRGISSVLAMSERIPDEVALTLTQLFYRNLRQGYPLDLCVSRVRQGLISAYGSHQVYWALPTLYLHKEFEGFLSPQLGVSGSSEVFGDYQASIGGFEGEVSNLDWLEDNNWDLDEVIHDDDEQDAAIVADLFRKINNKPVASEQMSVTQSEIPIKAQESTRGERELGVGSDSSTPKSSSQESVRRFSPLPPLTKVTVRRRHQGTILVVSGLAMIIALIWWWNRRPLVANITNIPLSSPREITEVINLKTAKTEIVSGQAITELSQGNLDSGLLAVEELLNRGAFKLADTALSSVPSKHWKNPALNFLRGRLAWQSAQIRDKKYSIDDARRYWDVAVKNQPSSVMYNNALGFAYYAEGKLNRANDVWFRSLNLSLKSNSDGLITVGSIGSADEKVSLDSLTAYGGLALGLYKSANGQSPNRRQRYIDEAVKLRQMIIQKEPGQFTVARLGQNWLWTEQAISDWHSLLQENQKR